MSHHQTEKTSRSKNAFGHRSLFCPVDLQAWLRGCAARQLVAELHERLEAERAILLVAQQEAAAHTRALIREDAATQLQSFWRSRKARRECEALRLKRWDQAPLRNQWPEVTVMLSPLQKAPLDNEDLEASSTSLPPDIASRRRVGEVRVGVPTCRQWNSRPMEYHELVAGTPRITREQESTTSVPRSRQTNLQVRAYPATTVPSGAQSAQVKRPPGPPKSKLLREVCTTKTQSTSSISSIWSPRSEYRRAPLISTPARGPEMSRAPRAVVASPTISGISTIGAPSQAPRQVRSQSQSSPYVTPFRQTRSFTPPGVMVPAWAWLPAPPVAVVKASPKEGMENLPQHALKVLPTPNRSRSLQRTPLRVIQVTRGSLNPNAGPPLRATLGPGAMPTIPWHPTVAAVRQTAWHVQSHSPEKP
eukprot:symbB.v1.2.003394.t1/scaffold190.1/size276550/19